MWKYFCIYRSDQIDWLWSGGAVPRPKLRLCFKCMPPQYMCIRIECRQCRLYVYASDNMLLCLSFGWMLWKGFSFPWRGFSDHPPLLSSVDLQAFLCCFYCLKTLNVPAISLADFFCFWSLTIVSPAWRDPFTAWCGFAATASKAT